MQQTFSIGIFDSGYGGLTVFRSIAAALPQYNYLYLGDNARAPYGDHAYETVYQYTLQSVEWLFSQGCRLVILACNTASAKALRTIQQRDLAAKYPGYRVLGVIRPTAECIGDYSRSKKVGIVGTRGTVNSESYPIEIGHFFPEVQVYQQSCPLWVPLIENNEHETAGAKYFVEKYLAQLLSKDPEIDTVLLACTHYPLLLRLINAYLGEGIQVVTQGDIVTARLTDYLDRHPEIRGGLQTGGSCKFFTTGDAASFNSHASVFFGEEIHSEQVSLT